MDTVVNIIHEVIESICNEYCKFPEQYTEDNEENLYSEHCEKCPLNKLW